MRKGSNIFEHFTENFPIEINGAMRHIVGLSFNCVNEFYFVFERSFIVLDILKLDSTGVTLNLLIVQLRRNNISTM